MSESTNAKSFAERAQSEPTELHKNFAAWIEEQTGIKPDLKTVQIVCSMRMDFQRSEENQTDLAKRKAEAAAKRKKQAAEKRARLEAQLKKLQAELSEETAAVEPAEKPAAKKTAAKATAAKAATPTPAEPAPTAEAPATPAKRAPRTRRAAAPKTATPAAK